MTVSFDSSGISYKGSTETSIHNLVNMTSCTLYAPLTTALALSKGIGDATYSRATTKWRFNELGYLQSVPSGCPEFGGARLIHNLCPTPSTTLAVSSTKTVTLTSPATLQFSMGAGTGTATFSGTGGATGTLTASTERVSVNKSVTAGTFIVTASVADLVDLQIVNVTSYVSTYIPDYLTVGVDSAPFKGAGIDGAKYFSTDYTGSSALTNLNGINLETSALNSLLRSRKFANPLVNDLTSGSAWLCTQTIGSELITNGTFDADANWTKGATWSIAAGVATCTTSVGDTISQNLVGLIQPGKTYVVTYTITRTTGSIVVSLGSIATDLGKIRSASGTYTDTIYCGANTTLYFYAYGSFAGTLDAVSIKECALQVTLVNGLDGGVNTATTLTASDTDATILQAITLGSAARCGSVYVKRRTGTGTVSFTIDGGSSWTDITAQINANTWTRVQVTATLTNPSVGFKISSIGDAIDVDCVQLESGTVATSPIVTTTATVTRNADSLTYQTASNWSDTAGTAYIEVMPVVYSGGAIGSATNGLLLSTSNSGATAFDGTNTANGPTGTPDASEKLALNWTGSAMKVASSSTLGTVGTYDGGMGLTNIGIGTGANGTFKNVSIYSSALSDSDMVRITS